MRVNMDQIRQKLTDELFILTMLEACLLPSLSSVDPHMELGQRDPWPVTRPSIAEPIVPCLSIQSRPG